MGIAREHDLHKRRFSRNRGVGLALAAFVAIIFGLTVVKVSNMDVVGSYDAGSLTAGGDK